jgi:hypothetical protein
MSLCHSNLEGSFQNHFPEVEYPGQGLFRHILTEWGGLSFNITLDGVFLLDKLLEKWFTLGFLNVAIDFCIKTHKY